MPLLNLFWSMLWFFLFFLWIVLVIRVFIDIFRSDDMGGFAKVLWILFVMFLPLFGVLIYVIARGHKMTEHAMADAAKQDAAFKAYVQQTAGSTSVSEELAKLTSLRDAGTITPAEYETAKAKVLA